MLYMNIHTICVNMYTYTYISGLAVLVSNSTLGHHLHGTCTGAPHGDPQEDPIYIPMWIPRGDPHACDTIWAPLGTSQPAVHVRIGHTVASTNVNHTVPTRHNRAPQ